jgi:uncharacterized protein
VQALPTISRKTARRLAITAQLLQGTHPSATGEGIMQTVRQIGCLQLDPLSVVARSHFLVLWSRIGTYDPLLLDTLLWEERQLFEYWAHAASIVLSEDYAIYQMRMHHWSEPSSSNQVRRFLQWGEENAALRQLILTALQERGPLRSRDLEDQSQTPWRSTGWTNERNVSRMLDLLWMQGRVLVSRRTSGAKWWDLAERCFPAWATIEPWSEHEIVRAAALKSLRALGIGTAKDISQHFTRNNYPGLPGVLTELEREGLIAHVRVQEGSSDLPGTWYMLADVLPAIDERLTNWQPRATLLSPFDNLICDRKRTAMLFDFTYSSEFYTPRHKRKYGYYVMPILYGDRLIGRLDPIMDRKQSILTIQALHLEPSVIMTPEIERAINMTVEELALFLGARKINHYSPSLITS